MAAAEHLVRVIEQLTESVLEIHERTIVFTAMLEEAFADHTVIEKIDADRMNIGIGGE